VLEGKEYSVIGPGFEMSSPSGVIRSRAPYLGEHTRQILSEAGLRDAQIEALIGDKAVIQATP
jgi:crotonobetainyl-CoA:carnitine CoA-transferase CaiB-like acyl-CoA transferase